MTAPARFVTCHSILQLDSTAPLGRLSIIDAQTMHKTVMTGFRNWVEDGADNAREQVGVLSTWSVDLKSKTLLLIVQSAVAPDWSAIPSSQLNAPVKTTTVDMTIRAGDLYEARTVVSARRIRLDRKTGDVRRLPHTDPHHVREWFTERLQPNPRTPHIGATTDPQKLAVRTLPPAIATTKHEGLKLPRHEIRGTLTVTDPNAFTNALTNGIGTGRAYSCGLILLRPSA